MTLLLLVFLVVSNRSPTHAPCPLALQLRKSYPLKSLHDLHITTPARASASQIPAQEQQQSSSKQLQRQPSMGHQHQVVSLRCASHHAVPEHRASYLMPDSNSAMFLASLIIQLLRLVFLYQYHLPLQSTGATICLHCQIPQAGLLQQALAVDGCLPAASCTSMFDCSAIIQRFYADSDC